MKASTHKPLISVIMPAFNAQAFAKQAIESILNQTLKDFELIIINDASTDDTYKIIKRYEAKDKRIRVVNNKENLQVAGCLNIGAKLARADLIARMDADDFSYPERLKLQYKLLKNNPKIAIVGADMIIVDEKGKPLFKREYPQEDQELKKVMFRYSPFAHPVVTMRRSVFEKFGGYNTKMVPCEDIDLWFKIGSKYKFANIRRTLLKYTLRTSSNSNKGLRELELLNFKIRVNAIGKYGYRPGFYDIIYNLGQFISMWIMPASFRVWLYNFLRSNGII